MEGKEYVLTETPHIDKTWHYVLPYVTPEKQKEAEMDFYKSFWMALAYSYVSLNSDGYFQTSVRKQKDTGGDYMDTELLFLKEERSTSEGSEILSMHCILIQGLYTIRAEHFQTTLKWIAVWTEMSTTDWR